MDRSVPVINRYKFVPQFVQKTVVVDKMAIIDSAYPDLMIKTLFKETLKTFRYDTVYSDFEIDYNRYKYIFEKQNY